MIAEEHVFETRAALALGLAADVAAALRKAVADKGTATLAVSGGTTPKLFFAELSKADVPWQKVMVTLVDERQVPETSTRSNARLVREHLLNATAAKFVPLFGNPHAADLELDTVVLGMGEDGHTASFFPGGDGLATALDPATTERIVEMTAPGAGEPRLTFTLPVLLAASFVALHFEGTAKRAVLDRALQEGAVEAMPVRAILRSKSPVMLYWCP